MPEHPNSTEELLIPLHNGRVEAARGERGQIIGVAITCLFTHDQIVELPDIMIQSAHDVIDRAAQRDAENAR